MNTSVYLVIAVVFFSAWCNAVPIHDLLEDARLTEVLDRGTEGSPINSRASLPSTEVLNLHLDASMTVPDGQYLSFIRSNRFVTEWLEKLGIEISKVADNMGRIRNRYPDPKLDVESIMWMAIGSEFFKVKAIKVPEDVRLPVTAEDPDEIAIIEKLNARKPLLTEIGINSGRAFWKMMWLKAQKDIPIDESNMYQMAIGSEILRNKVAIFRRESLPESKN